MLHIGDIPVDPPVILAPMAGVTNLAFRRLCREFGAGLVVTEMITSRALVERTPTSMRLIAHDPGAYPRSIQLYGVDPATVAAAVAMVVGENLADHIDLNFGCPVPKVTRKGGGAALPWKSQLFAAIVRQAVAAAGQVPVTVKMRIGIDEQHITYLDAARSARDAGVAAIALHARTAAQHYSGHAHWQAIARLKQEITDVPILGNGDIFSAEDELEMMRVTKCDGVVIGRGCQGRPWLFADLAAALRGDSFRMRPTLGEVCAIVERHATYQIADYGEEARAMRDMRKHLTWYFRGYALGGHTRAALAQVSSYAQMCDIFATLDPAEPWPGAAEGPRGRAGSPKAPSLPDGWLSSREVADADARLLRHAELDVSGG